jgi:PHS family inorganic phosphate transporter-like MFS transporter
LLAWIFSNQGWGTLAASVVTIVLLKCFEKAIEDDGKEGQIDAIWRIQMGVALVPAFATLVQRLMMPEGKKFTESRALNTPASSSSSIHYGVAGHSVPEEPAPISGGGPVSAETTTEHSGGPHNAPLPLLSNAKLRPDPLQPHTALDLKDIAKLTEKADEKAKLDAFFIYFSEWRHLKVLIGTASCWFFLDVAFYGTNLNQSVLLADIGFSTGSTMWKTLMKNAIGNLIIAVSGYVPGYFVTVALVERLGRKWIQIQGFLMAALMFAILAGGYNKIGTAGKFTCFALAQVSSMTIDQNKALTKMCRSSSSISGLTLRLSSFPPKSFPRGSEGFHTVSPPPAEKLGQFSLPSFSTGFQAKRSSDWLTSCGSSSRFLCWVLSVLSS